MKNKNKLLVTSIILATSINAFAATKNDPHLPISHCYHWLDQRNSGFLTYKYNYGDANNGDVAFVAGKNGAIAGPGLYCAKSPSGSYSYGDRVIRLELVDDIVMYDSINNKKYCGHDGNFYPPSKCQQLPWDIKFYTGGGVGNYAWYVIKDPQAIARWSANSDQLISDLQASKALNGGAAGTHFDQTVSRINAERATMGEKIYVNQNARMSILQVLTKPNLLRQMPALTVISKVAQVPDSDFSKRKKAQVYKEQFKRSLEDSFLSFDDFEGTLKINKDILKSFISVIKNLSDKELSSANIPVIMLTLDKYDTIQSHFAKKLWDIALLAKGPLQVIVDQKLDSSSEIVKTFEYALLHNLDNMDKIQAHNRVPMITLLDTYAQNARYKNQYSKIIEDILIKALEVKSDTVNVIKKLSNKNINKDRAIKNALNHHYADSFKDLDLITVGHLTDLVTLDATTKSNYHTTLKNMVIPNDKTPTYLMIDNLQKGVVTLPSMISEYEYLTKLIDRAINERGQKGMTNFFRFTYSDIFHYYYNLIKQEDDDTKKQQLITNASDMFYKLANYLDDEQFKSYGYILTQNASFLEMGLKYKDHPIQGAYDKYKTGDANFDAYFEKVAQYALEGSFLQFVLRKADDDQKAKDLLDIMVGHILSPNFDSWLKSNEFKLSQGEKEHWKNMITNKRYVRGGQFVSSDICRLSKVMYMKKKYFKQHLTKQDADDFHQVSIDIYKSKICK